MPSLYRAAQCSVKKLQRTHHQRQLCRINAIVNYVYNPPHPPGAPREPEACFPPTNRCADNCSCANGLLQCGDGRICMKLCSLTRGGCHPSVNGGQGCTCPGKARYCNDANGYTCQAPCPSLGPCGSGCTCPSGQTWCGCWRARGGGPGREGGLCVGRVEAEKLGAHAAVSRARHTHAWPRTARPAPDAPSIQPSRRAAP